MIGPQDQLLNEPEPPLFSKSDNHIFENQAKILNITELKFMNNIFM